MYIDCLNKKKEILGENHPDTLSFMNNLALLYKKQGKYDKAEPLYIDCLNKNKEIIGENHPDTLSSMNSSAILY